jgi:hypothetical protein
MRVMPGDLVVGDREGIYFVPPQLAREVVDKADEVHVHDEWTRKKFDEGQYKSSEIYGGPRDPALQKEYKEDLAKRLRRSAEKNRGGGLLKFAFAADTESSEKTAFCCNARDRGMRVLDRTASGQHDHVWTAG